MASWTTEDDHRLVKAMEKGASLESIAKGAVQFSRIFTLQELKARWELLYDSVVSEEDSARMIAYERSASTPTSEFGGGTENSNDDEGLSRMRKSDDTDQSTVRSCYYASRKRIQNEALKPVESQQSRELANDLQLKPSTNCNSENVCHVLEANNLVYNSVDWPWGSTWPAYGSLSESAGISGQMNNIDSEKIISQFQDEGLFSSGIPVKIGVRGDDLYEGYVSALLHENFANYEPFYMDVRSINTKDNPHFDDLSLVWPDCPNISDQDQMPDVANQTVTSETKEVNEVAGSCTVDGPESCNKEVLTPSSAPTSSASQFPELTNGNICCMLNTEDPEIPCNDDVFFPTQPCPKGKTKEIMLGKPLSQNSVASFVDKPAPCSERHNSYRPVNSSAIRQEGDAAEVVSSDVFSPKPQPDLEDISSEHETDDDVPYFSDVEAVILDQDLARFG